MVISRGMTQKKAAGEINYLKKTCHQNLKNIEMPTVPQLQISHYVYACSVFNSQQWNNTKSQDFDILQLPHCQDFDIFLDCTRVGTLTINLSKCQNSTGYPTCPPPPPPHSPEWKTIDIDRCITVYTLENISRHVCSSRRSCKLNPRFDSLQTILVYDI